MKTPATKSTGNRSLKGSRMADPLPLPTPLALVALIRGADTSEQGEHLLKMWLEQWRNPPRKPDGHAAFAASIKAGIQPPSL